MLFADVDVEAARRARTWNAFNNPVRDRRPESYGSMGKVRPDTSCSRGPACHKRASAFAASMLYVLCRVRSLYGAGRQPPLEEPL